MQNQQKKHINNKNLLICVTGSVATIKLPLLIQSLKNQYNLKIILTKSSKHFLKQHEIKLIQQQIQTYQDHMQMQQWSKMGDKVLHIQLRKWAHCILIAPLSANTMAKITNGISDNLISLVCRCWDFSKRQYKQKSLNTQNKKKYYSQLNYPFIVCPAMNTMMFNHPITQQHICKMKKWGITVMDTQQKLLACGDKGLGAMGSVQQITKIVNQIMINLSNQ